VIHSKLSPISNDDTSNVAKDFRGHAKYFQDVRSNFEVLQSISKFAKWVLTISSRDGTVHR
jgi:hypothetical protein